MANAPGAGRRVMWVILAQMVCTAAILPISHVPGPVMPALTPFFLSGILTTELATSYLLFAWFHEIRTRPLLLLAAAYLFSALLLIDYLLTFPSAILPDKVFIGGPQTAAWVFIIWSNGYAALTLAAAALQWRGTNQRLSPAEARDAGHKAIGAVAAVAILTLLGAAFEDFLPTLVAGAGFTRLDKTLAGAGLVMLLLGSTIILVHLRKQSELFAWLAIALVSMFCADLLTVVGGARYSVGWSAARLSWVISASVMFLFFVRQFVRRQRALVVTREALEEAVAQRTADLTEAVRQRDLLLREVYHRVKNNLQVVDALIAMERQRLNDPAAREALSALRNRVFSLGLVHQQLMSSDDLATFPIAPFLQELCDNVFASLILEDRSMRLDVEAGPIRVNLDFAIPIGLLTTELLSNTAKRARATGVRVTFQRSGVGEATLAVEDDDPMAETAGPAQDTGTGARILEGLTRQLEGRMQVVRDHGVQVRIHMPLPVIAA